MTSHLRDSNPDRVEIPNHPDLWVEFKAEASFHDELKVEQYRQEVLSRAEIDPATGERKLDAYLIADFVVSKASVMVSAWNLTDPEGKPLPVNAASLVLLRADVLRFIGDEAASRFSGRPEAKEAPFEKPSRRISRRAKG